MKKILKSWITWAIVAVACICGVIYFNGQSKEVTEPVVEPVVETVTDEQVATEMEEDIVEIDSMIVNEVETTNTVETNE